MHVHARPSPGCDAALNRCCSLHGGPALQAYRSREALHLCRDLIADSVETVMGGQWYDANVSLPGCDKNMPGTIIAMARLNRPAVMVYGGTIKPGYSRLDDRPIDIVSAFQSYGTSLVLPHRGPLTTHFGWGCLQAPTGAPAAPLNNVKWQDSLVKLC